MSSSLIYLKYFGTICVFIIKYLEIAFICCLFFYLIMILYLSKFILAFFWDFFMSCLYLNRLNHFKALEPIFWIPTPKQSSSPNPPANIIIINKFSIYFPPIKVLFISTKRFNAYNKISKGFYGTGLLIFLPVPIRQHLLRTHQQLFWVSRLVFLWFLILLVLPHNLSLGCPLSELEFNIWENFFYIFIK